MAKPTTTALSLLGALCVLGGCAGQMISEGVTPLLGRPIDAAMAKLGLPDAEQMIAGRKVYIWFARDVTEGTERKCRIRAIMAAGVIDAFDVDGNNGVCMRYAERLRGG